MKLNELQSCIEMYSVVPKWIFDKIFRVALEGDTCLEIKLNTHDNDITEIIDGLRGFGYTAIIDYQIDGCTFILIGGW